MIRNIARAIIITACLAFTANAQADLMNGGFESLFSNWTTVGPNSAVSSLDGEVPTEGGQMAYLNSGSGSLPVVVHDAVLSGFLGLPANSIGTLFANSTEGAVLFQSFTSGAGQTGMSFDWNFMTNEGLQNPTFNDVAFATVWDTSGNLIASAFLDTFSAFAGSGSAFSSHTGWVTTTFTNLNPNTAYNIVFGVFDRQDGVVDSAVLIDNIASIPEPGMGLIGLAVVLSGAAIRRRR